MLSTVAPDKDLNHRGALAQAAPQQVVPLSHSAKSFGGASSGSNGLVIIVPDLIALHNDKTPPGLNFALGGKANDVIHAAAGDVDALDSVCFISPGLGNDRILVSTGAIYMQDKGGTDSVFVLDAAGQLASIGDIVLTATDPSNPTSVALMVGLDLYLASTGVENFTFAVDGELQFQADDQNVLVIKGTKYADTITGGSLPDQLEGLAGNDKLSGGDGDDILNGGSGNDILQGGNGADTLNGFTGNDRLLGGDGIDVLNGDAGNDLLEGGASADELHGGDGIDTLSYAGSDQGVSVTLGANGLIGSASGGHATGDTGDGFENITGSPFDDTLQGNDLANILKGGAGNDILIGGGGRDTMDGGLDGDNFLFNAASDTGNTATTRDIITGFTHLTDVIDVSAIASFAWLGKEAFTATAPELRYITQNLDGTAKDMTIIQGDVDGDGIADFQIQLKGIVTLTVDDFVL